MTNTLWIIEMSLVSPPYVLDFAGAYLDWAPDFSEEVMADWRAEKQEQFEQHWPEVQAILAVLETYGVFMVDVNPGNISFGDHFDNKGIMFTDGKKNRVSSVFTAETELTLFF